MQPLFYIRVMAGVMLCLGLATEAQASRITFTKIADTNTVIPNGRGNFTFFTAPSLDRGNVAFQAEGANNQTGIYTDIGGLKRVADTATPIPDGQGNFGGFSFPPSIDGGNVAFRGFGGNDQTGVYTDVGGLKRVADKTTVIPNGQGNFTSLFDPSLSGGNVAFRGAGANNQEGIYTQVGGQLNRVADTATVIPGGQGSFEGFLDPSLSGGNVAFHGLGGNNQEGIYTTVGGPLRKVADKSTAVPGGQGNFTSFFDAVLDGMNIAFGGGSGTQRGVYTEIGGRLRKAADTATAIPGGQGNFTAFTDLSLSGANVAFLGLGGNNQMGIYSDIGDQLRKIIALGDRLDGKALAELTFDREGLSGRSIAFKARFHDGSMGIFRADKVPEPATLLLFGAGLLGLGALAQRQRHNSPAATRRPALPGTAGKRFRAGAAWTSPILLGFLEQAVSAPIYEPIHQPANMATANITQIVRGPGRPTLVFISRETVRAGNDTGFDIVDLRWQIPSEQELKDFLAEPDPKKRKFELGAAGQPQIITDPANARYNTGNQDVRFGNVQGSRKIGESEFFEKRKPDGQGPTADLELFDGVIKKDRVFTDTKTVMKDSTNGQEIAFKSHWAAVSYSVESKATGQSSGGKSDRSLSFSSDGTLALTAFQLSSAYLTDRLDGLDIATVDSEFQGDLILGATLAVSPFRLAYLFTEDGIEKAYFENPGGVLTLTQGADTLLTASVNSGMVFDPTQNVPFFAPLTDIVLNAGAGSGFLGQMQTRLLDPDELAFDLFISPDADFFQRTAGFTLPATVSANAGIAQNGHADIPEPGALALAGVGVLALLGRSRRCRERPRYPLTSA